MIDEENDVYQDWLEFEALVVGESSFYIKRGPYFINVRRTEISEVRDDIKDAWEGHCSIVMKNGSRYVVKMPYNKVMEMV